MPRQKPEFIEFVKKEFQSAPIAAGLIEHIEAIELELKVSKEDEQEAVREVGIAFKNVDRLTENVAQLKRELDESREAKKVVLPIEVAEAIEEVRLLENDIDYLIWQIIREDTHNNKSMQLLNDRASSHSLFDLMDAIRYGYTVEKTKEERLREGIGQIVREWFRNKAASPIKDVAGDIADFVTKFNAKN